MTLPVEDSASFVLDDAHPTTFPTLSMGGKLWQQFTDAPKPQERVPTGHTLPGQCACNTTDAMCLWCIGMRGIRDVDTITDGFDGPFWDSLRESCFRVVDWYHDRAISVTTQFDGKRRTPIEGRETLKRKGTPRTSIDKSFGLGVIPVVYYGADWICETSAGELCDKDTPLIAALHLGYVIDYPDRIEGKLRELSEESLAKCEQLRTAEPAERAKFAILCTSLVACEVRRLYEEACGGSIYPDEATLVDEPVPGVLLDEMLISDSYVLFWTYDDQSERCVPEYTTTALSRALNDLLDYPDDLADGDPFSVVLCGWTHDIPLFTERVRGSLWRTALEHDRGWWICAATAAWQVLGQRHRPFAHMQAHRMHQPTRYGLVSQTFPDGQWDSLTQSVDLGEQEPFRAVTQELVRVDHGSVEEVITRTCSTAKERTHNGCTCPTRWLELDSLRTRVAKVLDDTQLVLKIMDLENLDREFMLDAVSALYCTPMAYSLSSDACPACSASLKEYRAPTPPEIAKAGADVRYSRLFSAICLCCHYLSSESIITYLTHTSRPAARPATSGNTLAVRVQESSHSSTRSVVTTPRGRLRSKTWWRHAIKSSAFWGRRS